jgi:glucose/arabinose dehydrogenase
MKGISNASAATLIRVPYLVCLGLLLGSGCEAQRAGLPGISLPPGFRIQLYAEAVPNARSMALGEQGTLFVGTRSDGRVYALRDSDGDQQADRRWTLASGLDMPNGVAFRGGSLYLAESGRVLRFDDIESRLDDPPEPVPVAELPAYRHHGWRYIGFGPDDRLYVALGAPCNVCEPGDLGSIISMRPDGSDRRLFARGVRNSVGFTWHPRTGDLWFTDNGRDWLGDDQPPDELNRAAEPGGHFGFPYCHGGDIPDPEFGPLRGCDQFTPPVRRLDPHVASLGVRFYMGDQFPPEYRNQVFVAEHGSWNRSRRIGWTSDQIATRSLTITSACPDRTLIRPAEPDRDADAEAVLRLLDAYAADPMGNNRGLPRATRARLVPTLREVPGHLVLLAFAGADAVGLAIAFQGFSTFRARPLLDVHDLSVLPAHRGGGVLRLHAPCRHPAQRHRLRQSPGHGPADGPRRAVVEPDGHSDPVRHPGAALGLGHRVGSTGRVPSRCGHWSGVYAFSARACSLSELIGSPPTMPMDQRRIFIYMILKHYFS